MEVDKIVSYQVEGIDFYFFYSNRVTNDFKEWTKKPITKMDDVEDSLKIFYLMAKAGAKKKGIPFEYTFDDFLDYDQMETVAAITFVFENLFTPKGKKKQKP